MAVITISRQYASGGNEVADHLCGLLHYRYFDRRLIADLAAELNRATGEPIDFGEDQYRAPGILDRLLNRVPHRPVTTVGDRSASATDVGAHKMVALDTKTAIALERSAIEAAYNRGDVVIVGRGGQAVLRGRPGVLHVRIEAPLESRIERLCKVVDFTPYAARQEILDHDRAAAAYVKRFYGVNWSDSSLYHLLINTELWGVADAARLIVSAVEDLESVAKPR